MNQPTQISNLDKVYKSLIVLALIIALLVMASDIIIPFAFACLFSVVLLPIEKRLEDKVGRILSITIVLVASLSLMTLVVWLVVNQLATLAQSLPNLEQRFVALLSRLNEQVSNTFGISSAEQIQLLKEALKNLSTYVGSALLSASFLIYFFIQVPIYIFLLLLYREKFSQFFLSFTDGAELKWKDEVTGVVRGYISGLTIVVLISGTLNSIGLLVIGIDNAFFFGFLIGALTMIPYVGIIIGAMFPALFALLHALV
jgi:predicted PurR-regulated permease PerM